MALQEGARILQQNVVVHQGRLMIHQMAVGKKSCWHAQGRLMIHEMVVGKKSCWHENEGCVGSTDDLLLEQAVDNDVSEEW